MSKEERIIFGYEGVLAIETPVLRFGTGNPRLAITCSVHGDEHVGVLIATRLTEQLHLLENELRGSVAIVLAANPAAQFVRTRVSPQDLKDLNRVGKGRLGSYTERVAHTLFQYLKNFDFVVNIHEFEMHTPITNVYMNIGPEETRQRMVEGISAFAPEIVWIIDYEQASDNQYISTLGASLAQAGIPNFPIETVQMSFITDTEVIKVVEGFLRLMHFLGILAPIERNTVPSFPKAYLRHEVTAEVAVIWEPVASLQRRVIRGDVIGQIYCLPTLQKESVVAPMNGVLLQIRHRQLVGTGASLFSIGEETTLKPK